MNSFGAIVKKYRDNFHMSQEETAKLLDISRVYLSELERDVSKNPSYDLGVSILNLPSLERSTHKTIEVTISRRIEVDALIAQEVVWLNHMGIVTISPRQGPPPISLIPPSSKDRAAKMGYKPVYQEDIGLFEIELRSGTEPDA